MPDAIVTKEQGGVADQKIARDRVDRQHEIRSALKTPDSRAWIGRVISQCGAGPTPSDPGFSLAEHEAVFAAGRWFVGTELIREIIEADPDLYAQLCGEMIAKSKLALEDMRAGRKKEE